MESHSVKWAATHVGSLDRRSALDCVLVHARRDAEVDVQEVINDNLSGVWCERRETLFHALELRSGRSIHKYHRLLPTLSVIAS